MAKENRSVGRTLLVGFTALLAALGVLLFMLLGGLEGATARIRADRWSAERPTGEDHLTARMRAVRDAVAKEFTLPYGSGCYREDGGVAGGGEHPLGRACDFMLGPAGARVSGAQEKEGTAIVDWVHQHAQEYGIWYVIYEQHIWSSLHPERGWLSMPDRGNVTENHFDHVHISVY